MACVNRLFRRFPGALPRLWRGRRGTRGNGLGKVSLDTVHIVNFVPLRDSAAGRRTISGGMARPASRPRIAAERRQGALPALLPVLLAALLAPLLPSAALARDSLGVYSTWGAFRDPSVPRCYAIAMAAPDQRQRDYQPFVAIGSWPRREVRGQVHFRLSRKLAASGTITLGIGRERFRLTGGGGDAWATDPRMDAAIVAAMRSAPQMTVYARDARGRPFSNTWPLAGAASAMDAAAIGCARLR